MFFITGTKSANGWFWFPRQWAEKLKINKNKHEDVSTFFAKNTAYD